MDQSDCKISSFKAKEFWNNNKNDFSFGAKFLELFYFWGISVPPKYDEGKHFCGYDTPAWFHKKVPQYF